MKTKLELQGDLDHAVRCAEDIQVLADGAKRALTADETNKINIHLADADSIKAEIAKLESDEAQRNRIAEYRNSLNTVPAPRAAATSVNDGQVPPNDQVRVVPTHERLGRLKAFRPSAFAGSHDKANYGAYATAQFIKALFYNNSNSDRWMRQNYGPDWRAAHTEGSNTAGGYLVLSPMETAIIDLREDYGVFRRNTRVRPMSSDTLDIPRKNGRWSASFTNESVALTESSSTFSNVKLVAKKLGGYATLSSELAEDAAISVVDQLVNDFAYGLALKEDQCAFLGDGSATYGGMVGLAPLFDVTPPVGTQLAGAVDAASGHDTFSEITVADLASIMGRLPDYARMNAKFYCSRVCSEMVFGAIKASGGGNTIQDLQGNVGNNYLGYPIVTSQVLPSGPTTDYSDDAIIFFGDLTMSSSLGERRGIRIGRSDEYRWVNDDIALKVTERFDIVHHDVGSSTTGDFGAVVALVGE